MILSETVGLLYRSNNFPAFFRVFDQTFGKLPVSIEKF